MVRTGHDPKVTGSQGRVFFKGVTWSDWYFQISYAFCPWAPGQIRMPFLREGTRSSRVVWNSSALANAGFSLEQSQCCPAWRMCHSQLAAPASRSAGSWNRLCGENSHSGQMWQTTVFFPRVLRCQQGNLAPVSGSSVISCCYFSCRFCLLQNVDLLQFCFGMLTFLLGFKAQVPSYIQMEDRLQALDKVENGSSWGTLGRTLGNLESLPGNQSRLLFWFTAFWTYCLDTLPPLDLWSDAKIP